MCNLKVLVHWTNIFWDSITAVKPGIPVTENSQKTKAEMFTESKEGSATWSLRCGTDLNFKK